MSGADRFCRSAWDTMAPMLQIFLTALTAMCLIVAYAAIEYDHVRSCNPTSLSTMLFRTPVDTNTTASRISRVGETGLVARDG